ncbi:hypothetical protein OIDMADRAFT_147800 [Oidiodendron maius Zn]|uniref:Uncharacterized protein n=1 Tax=Oidiodendron maius (strain Zn) TaxID=913774 RepID=A0A0C3H1T6_OIDMZ|nr:hypothetical protein OIDMADRAFT_147800 [Oidiodendron maius Zn]
MICGVRKIGKEAAKPGPSVKQAEEYNWKSWKIRQVFLIPLILLAAILAAILELLVQLTKKPLDSSQLQTTWLNWYASDTDIEVEELLPPTLAFLNASTSIRGILTFENVSSIPGFYYFLWIYLPTIVFVLYVTALQYANDAVAASTHLDSTAVTAEVDAPIVGVLWGLENWGLGQLDIDGQSENNVTDMGIIQSRVYVDSTLSRAQEERVERRTCTRVLLYWQVSPQPMTTFFPPSFVGIQIVENSARVSGEQDYPLGWNFLELSLICFGIVVSMTQGQGFTINGAYANQWTAAALVVAVLMFLPFYRQYFIWRLPILGQNPSSLGMTLSYIYASNRLCEDLMPVAEMSKGEREKYLQSLVGQYAFGKVESAEGQVVGIKRLDALFSRVY